MTSRLLSVNVGLPRELEWEGRTVRTAIWKAPVDGPRMVRRINIDGDDQADRVAHGGEHRAVYVYQLDSYRHWERELGRDDFSPGQFGENFTVEGLNDDEVCIGDRYRIGGALFEVTQPRVTCYRLGIRMDEPAMPALLVAHHRPGFYMRVLEEGVVEAGDEITREAAGPEQLTVAEIDALLYLPGRSRRTLRRALRIPALSVGWQGSFRDLLARAEDGEAPAAAEPAWPGFLPLRVTAITPREQRRHVVPPPAGRSSASGLAGQYLTVRLEPDGPDSAPLLRSYSLSSLPGPGDPHQRQAGARRRGRRVPARAVRVGDRLAAAAPRGTFVLRDGDGPVVLMSAGVGATPVLARLHTLAREPTPRPVWWVHGARNAAEHAFGAEVHALLAALPDAHRLVSYSAPGPSDVAGETFDVSGRLDAAALAAAGVPVDADYYLCGPDGFMRGLGAALTARGVPPERVGTEVFGSAGAYRPGMVDGAGPPPHPPPGRRCRPGGPVPRSDLSVPWSPGTGACSSWRRRATSRSASAAGPGCATAASPARSPVPWSTSPRRSSHRPRARRSCVARDRRRSSCWTCDASGDDRATAPTRPAAGCERLTPAQTYAAQQQGAVVVDIRGDDQRARGGHVPGARFVARNVLEWRCDPASPWRDPELARPDLHLILRAWFEGYQSSLAAATLQRFGLRRATDVDAGFQAWREDGLPVTWPDDVEWLGVAGAGAPAGLQNR